MPLVPIQENSGDSTDGRFPEKVYHAMAETFRSLADPTRTQIVHLLTHGERTVNNLAEHLSVSPSAVSHQLRVLRQMGLVRFRREGQWAFYSLDDPHIERLFHEAHRHVLDFLGQG
ncbi:MAG: metalloregulator ArsR/SmtB family transcription factor [Acidobacteriota bacterium]|jgi:ArsR family transcriptional regulator, lead/cadmium/zinc/bismuth-responsive transcriptional repressor